MLALVVMIMRHTNFSRWNVKTKLSSRKFRPKSHLALTVHTSNMHFLFLWNKSYHIRSVHNLNLRTLELDSLDQILASGNPRKDTLNKWFWLLFCASIFIMRVSTEMINVLPLQHHLDCYTRKSSSRQDTEHTPGGLCRCAAQTVPRLHSLQMHLMTNTGFQNIFPWYRWGNTAITARVSGRKC